MSDDCYISGRWLAAKGEDMTSLDPASGDIVWTGHAATPVEIDAAMQAAKSAYPQWAARPFADRLACLEKFKAIITARKSEMAELIARETGKALWDAAGEAGVLAAKVDLTIKSYRERTGEITLDMPFGRAELTHRPHGVMAVLGPYNFPAHLPNGQILPALLAGNTVVFKPSELTPAVGAALIQAYHDAGFPAGTVNLVQGARATGAALLEHPHIAGVLFTGSAGGGAAIHKMFGGRPEIVLALEMGGNNPLIVWDADNAKAAASHVIQSAFITSGQRCTCARRIILPSGQAGDAVEREILSAVDALTLGAWNDDAPVFMGPVVSADIASRIIASARALGEKGGKVLRECRSTSRGAAFLSPGVIDVTGLDMPDEEIFGPVMQIIRAGSFDEALDMANATRFGLAAGLISDRAALWPYFAQRIHAGVVNFNRPTTGASGALPFGGPGASGNHNPGAYYAADFCAWPMASQVSDALTEVTAPGLPFVEGAHNGV